MDTALSLQPASTLKQQQPFDSLLPAAAPIVNPIDYPSPPLSNGNGMSAHSSNTLSPPSHYGSYTATQPPTSDTRNESSLEEEESAGGPPLPAVGQEEAARKEPLGVEVQPEQDRRSDLLDTDTVMLQAGDKDTEGRSADAVRAAAALGDEGLDAPAGDGEGAGEASNVGEGVPGTNHELEVGAGEVKVNGQQTEVVPALSADVEHPTDLKAPSADEVDLSVPSTSTAPLSVALDTSFLAAAPVPSVARPPLASPLPTQPNGDESVKRQRSETRESSTLGIDHVNNEHSHLATPAASPEMTVQQPSFPAPVPQINGTSLAPSQPATSVSPLPPPPVYTGQAAPPPGPVPPSVFGPINDRRYKWALSVVKALKKHREAGPFLAPVDIVTLKIPDYPNIIKEPMDLGTVEQKLMVSKPDKAGKVSKPAPGATIQPYSALEEWVEDVRRIWRNCYRYNGPPERNLISKMARSLEDQFEKQLPKAPSFQSQPSTSKVSAASAALPSVASTSSVPPASVSAPPTMKIETKLSPMSYEGESPSVPKKKERRQSIPIAPQPRRSSSDGRPKREIHPPPSKTLPYFEDQLEVSHSKTKKKSTSAKSSKLAAEELKFAEKVMKEVHKTKHYAFTTPFLQPVDAVALGIPDYPKIIKKPMDLSTIRRKLDNNEYREGGAFESDFRLMLKNCFTYNALPENPVHVMGRKLESLFNEKWAERPVEVEEEEPEEEEDEGDDQITEMERQLSLISQSLESLREMKMKKAAVTAAAKVAKPPKPPKATNGNGKAPRSPTQTKRPPKPKKKKNKDDNEDWGEVTFEMKRDLANQIANFEGDKLEQAVHIIRTSAPHLLNGGDEVELDIDMLDELTLHRLYNFVVGRPKPAKKGRKSTGETSTTAAGTVAKKSGRGGTGGVNRKNLDEAAEAQRIALLESKLQAFDSVGQPAGASAGVPADGVGGAGELASSSSESEDGSDSESDSGSE